ncbi:hypothetical protein LVIS_1112 [Levilactobacillus brevis ATCC 367]|uniref:Uncharacterized protein n=1 Tax=Levilactobacillus brevis (strain ATCC 367 / BCRC 12310 / CIP 105137 / JCM 1170 / LMG 11437 / NCIMB 947 / NCTC 947) TaxID=387344 RepID=Q03RD1_LEVBA|nr:hypothetical protein LVIS_1112 [Levilactobacillus brevis ATCC 367]
MMVVQAMVIIKTSVEGVKLETNR